METETPFRLALVAITAVSLPVGGYFRLRAARAGGPVSRRGEGWFIMVTLRLCALFAATTMLLWLMNPAWTAWAAWSLPGWARWSGVFIWAGAFALLVWVFVHLGLNVTDTVAVRVRNTLVQSGPYRLARHPMYVAFALVSVAFSLLSANWLIALLGGAALALLARRTPIEEARLIERHGEQYRSYMRRVGRYFPRLRAVTTPEPMNSVTL